MMKSHDVDAVLCVRVDFTPGQNSNSGNGKTGAQDNSVNRRGVCWVLVELSSRRRRTCWNIDSCSLSRSILVLRFLSVCGALSFFFVVVACCCCCCVCSPCSSRFGVYFTVIIFSVSFHRSHNASRSRRCMKHAGKHAGAI